MRSFSVSANPDFSLILATRRPSPSSQLALQDCAHVGLRSAPWGEGKRQPMHRHQREQQGQGHAIFFLSHMRPRGRAREAVLGT